MKDHRFSVFLFATLYLAYETSLEAEDKKKLYVRGVKHNLKKSTEAVEQFLTPFLNSMGDEDSKSFYTIVDVLKNTIASAVDHDPMIIVSILKDYQEGNVMQLENPEKHGKFIKQNTLKVGS